MWGVRCGASGLVFCCPIESRFPPSKGGTGRVLRWHGRQRVGWGRPPLFPPERGETRGAEVCCCRMESRSPPSKGGTGRVLRWHERQRGGRGRPPLFPPERGETQRLVFCCPMELSRQSRRVTSPFPMRVFSDHGTTDRPARRPVKREQTGRPAPDRVQRRYGSSGGRHGGPAAARGWRPSPPIRAHRPPRSRLCDTARSAGSTSRWVRSETATTMPDCCCTEKMTGA